LGHLGGVKLYEIQILGALAAMTRWYLIHTKSGAEATAEAHLERQGYEVYLPRLAEVVRRRSRWQERVVPLFPRYLFLRLDQGSQVLCPVRSTRGVTNVIRFGSDYAIVPDQLIQAIQARADAETGLHRLPPPALPARGSTVRLANGPFEGVEGIFVCKSGDDRVVVLLNLLGRETRVQVPIHSILPSLAAAACE
jgi:transcriptional antiterminator RfaH